MTQPEQTPDDLSDVADVELPDVGSDAAPSSEMIVEGKVGNGTWDKFTPELASRMQAERTEHKRELKQAREDAYEEGMKDALAESAALTTGLVRIGNEILERLEQGEEMDRLMLDTLKLSNTANAQVPDRAIGKAKARQESENQTTILNLFQVGAGDAGTKQRGSSGSEVVEGRLSHLLPGDAEDQDEER